MGKKLNSMKEEVIIVNGEKCPDSPLELIEFVEEKVSLLIHQLDLPCINDRERQQIRKKNQ